MCESWQYFTDINDIVMSDSEKIPGITFFLNQFITKGVIAEVY